MASTRRERARHLCSPQRGGRGCARGQVGRRRGPSPPSRPRSPPSAQTPPAPGSRAATSTPLSRTRACGRSCALRGVSSGGLHGRGLRASGPSRTGLDGPAGHRSVHLEERHAARLPRPRDGRRAWRRHLQAAAAPGLTLRTLEGPPTGWSRCGVAPGSPCRTSSSSWRARWPTTTPRDGASTRT